MESQHPPTSPSTAAAPPPLPVQQLDYSAPRASRPGILTAVAVLSIVIGALSLLMACSGGISAVMFQMMPMVAPPAPVPMTPPPTTPAPTPAPVPAAPTSPPAATSASTTTTSAVISTTVVSPGVALPGFGNPQNVAVMAFGIADAVIRLLLAVLLIVAGVFVLRDHRLGRRLHLIWAWIKIPVSLLGAVVYWQTMSTFFASMPAGTAPGVTPQYMSSMMLITGLVQAGVACAYPLGVLIVMKTRTVRDFYASLVGQTL